MEEQGVVEQAMNDKNNTIEAEKVCKMLKEIIIVSFYYNEEYHACERACDHYLNIDPQDAEIWGIAGFCYKFLAKKTKFNDFNKHYLRSSLFCYRKAHELDPDLCTVKELEFRQREIEELQSRKTRKKRK